MKLFYFFSFLVVSLLLEFGWFLLDHWLHELIWNNKIRYIYWLSNSMLILAVIFFVYGDVINDRCFSIWKLEYNFISLFIDRDTLFSFRDLRAARMEIKPRGIYWPQSQVGRGEEKRKLTFFFCLLFFISRLACAPLIVKTTEKRL